MRLIDIKRYINIAFENFSPKYSNSNGNYYIDNVLNVKKAVQALQKARFVSLDNPLLENINASITDRLILNNSQDSQYQILFNKIQYMITALHEWANSYIPTEERDTTVNIKLPPIENLKDLSVTASIIQKSFSRVVSEFGGELKIKQFDHGSYWIVLDANDIETVKFVGTLVSAGWCIAKSSVFLIKSYLEIQSMGLDNQIKKLDIERLEREVIKKRAEEKAKELNEEYFKRENEKETDINERLDRIAASLSEIVKLLKIGGEVYPALTSSPEVEEVFPNFKEKLIEYTKIDLLENKKNNPEAEQ